MDRFRPGTHGERLKEPKASGEPVKPGEMDSLASALWDKIVPKLVEMRTVKEIDTEAVVAACEMWSLYRKALAAALVYPCDKNVRSAVVAYWSAFDKAAGKLGMNPADRAKLSVPHEHGAAGVEAFGRKRV
jgi:phage terminase small subunit